MSTTESKDENGLATDESPEEERQSERVPASVSGEGKTPLGSTDQHSDAEGPDGTG